MINSANRLLLVIVAFSLLSISSILNAKSKPIELRSPNGKLVLSIDIRDKIYYNISHNTTSLLKDCYLGMDLKDKNLGVNPILRKQSRKSVDEVLKPVVPLKFSAIKNKYNNLILDFKDDYSVEFRVFDNGLAYRFITNFKKGIEVTNEDFFLGYTDDYKVILQQPGSFKTAYEENYSYKDLKNWRKSDYMSTLPLLIDTKKQYKILVSESNLVDYPAMFLKGDGDGNIYSTFPKCPIEFGEDGDRSLKILKEADYIAKTSGKRNFPWRFFVVAEEDGQIVENTLNFQLSEPNKIEDTSWIKPGQASWEWWNDASPYGEGVDFVSGYNLDTYKYFIDFASKYGIKYVIMDEGWAKTTLDPYTPNPTVNVHELIKYGKEKNVDIILWLTWLTVEQNFELFKTFNEWGIAGIKIDFMDRSDQWMVNFYERVAKEAAKHKMLVDFHGSFKPAGLENAYPNVISYEGVRGMEQMAPDGATPNNSVYFPFIRNAVGPMDYTPGAMISMQPEVYKSQRPNSASMGTRAYQLALFVVFESGLQMLADNPTMYYRNADCTEFITGVPTTWDETKVLEAKVGEYIIVAKRKGNIWHIGGMCNGHVEERIFNINLDFLSDGKSHEMTYFEDGINAKRQAMDYRRKFLTVKNGSSIKIKMVRNGGWAAVIK